MSAAAHMRTSSHAVPLLRKTDVCTDDCNDKISPWVNQGVDCHQAAKHSRPAELHS